MRLRLASILAAFAFAPLASSMAAPPHIAPRAAAAAGPIAATRALPAAVANAGVPLSVPGPAS